MHRCCRRQPKQSKDSGTDMDGAHQAQGKRGRTKAMSNCKYKVLNAKINELLYYIFHVFVIVVVISSAFPAI